MVLSIAKFGRTAVCAIFKDGDSFQSAIDTLKKKGFRGGDISALLPAKGNSDTFSFRRTNKAAEWAMIGVLCGWVICGLLGWLSVINSAGIKSESIVIPTSSFAAIFFGMGIGSLLGGLCGAVLGWTIPVYVAERYDSYLREGDYLVSVHADSVELKHRAKNILLSNGAYDVGVMQEKVAVKPRIRRPEDNVDIDPFIQMGV